MSTPQHPDRVHAHRHHRHARPIGAASSSPPSSAPPSSGTTSSSTPRRRPGVRPAVLRSRSAPIGPLLAFATVGVSFLFRPLGAFLAGHFGDKFGRKVVLMLTLILMGGATALIGLLPTYAPIGIAAPVLLVLLRILQGISAGGEWGGAVLMAVEHAPTTSAGCSAPRRRSASRSACCSPPACMALMTVIAPGDAFLEWGWRDPVPARRRADRRSATTCAAASRRARCSLELAERKRRDPDADRAAVPQARAARARRRARLRRQQRRRLHDDRRLHPELRHQPRRADRARARPGAVGGRRLRASPGCSPRSSPAAISDRIGRRTTYIIGWVLQLVGVFALFPLVNTGHDRAAVLRHSRS